MMFQRVVLMATLTGLGAVLIFLRQYPGTVSNIVAWLETEGATISLLMGCVLCFFGIRMLISTFTLLFSHRIAFTKGPLIYSVKAGLFEQIVQQLWSEYFDRPDLRAYVSLHGSTLNITGETPQDFDNIDELTAFLSHKLLSLTGYWGDLSIHTSSEAKVVESPSQKL